MKHKVKVLSLFDGMACGHIAMQVAGLEVESYDAYEIDKFATKVASHNFPDITQNGDVFKEDFSKYTGVDFLIGGSPCTYWSIAQTNNRETEASGLGWELFSQYVRALKEAKPRFFIYENNKSMSKQIRASIDATFGFEAVLINSALVSAQNRQRLYWVGKRNENGTYSKVQVEMPEDRGILLRDILESGEDLTKNDKTFALTASYDGDVAWNTIERHQRNMVAEPVRVGTMPQLNGVLKDNQATRIYSQDGKSVTQSAQGGGWGAKTGLYAIEALDYIPRASCSESFVDFDDSKSHVVTAAHAPKVIHEMTKAEIQQATHGHGEANTLRTSYGGHCVRRNLEEKAPVYEVRDGKITIKGKQYEIKLRNGFYIIRKLTVNECKSLQTVPEWYDFSCVSNTQAYKCLGNGWTVDVIAHLIKSAIKEDEE